MVCHSPPSSMLIITVPPPLFIALLCLMRMEVPTAPDIHESKLLELAKVINHIRRRCNNPSDSECSSRCVPLSLFIDVEKNMYKHLNYKSVKEFRSLLYYYTSHANFEERWSTFVGKWKTEKTEEWLNRMHT